MDNEKMIEELIVVGCNYHTNWQKEKGMRFVLKEIKGTKALLITRRTRKRFWTDISSLIFIKTKHNFKKAKNFIKNERRTYNI